jgi:hypothetical protein
MSEKTTTTIEGGDPLLTELAEVTHPLSEQAEASNEHALLVLGVKHIVDNDLGEGVQTYFAATGYYGVIAEGLYAELGDQIETGNPALFALIRQVIRDLEEDYGIMDDSVPREKHTLN